MSSGGDVTDWTCTACGQSSPAGTRFCGHCGTPAAAAPAVQTWACRACGTANLPTMVFCGGCGAKSQPGRTEELRLVTALFADISGFTTLADTLDTESLHEVITPLVAGLTGIAERYEGFIEKFAGDALLVVYGAPVTHEDDAQRALLTALDMHAQLPRLLAQLPPSAANLTIHIGVNTGRVIGRQAGSEHQSDYAVLGDSVILAQRLESACPPGETYVGRTTRELCRGEFAFESVGELSLKGKVLPVEAFRLLGRHLTPRTAARPLVGRREELEALDAALDTAAAGAGVAVVLAGEPGTGKSRLVDELQAHAAVRSMRWLPARCLSYGAALPYWPFTDLLRQVTGLAADASATDVQAALTRHLPAPSVPGAQRLLGLVQDDADPQRARREVHDAVTTWLSDLARTRPVVLCVEDVHWLDRASRDLLGELIRATRSLPVQVLLTTRPEGVAEVAPLVADVGARSVSLGPLELALVPELAAAVLGAPAAPALVELLSAKTGGNPLFVEELSRALQESGALVDAPGGMEVKAGYDTAAVPETVERVFATRLDALPSDAAGLLQVASVVGRNVRLSLLAAVAGPAMAALEPLDSLVSAGLLNRLVDSGEPAVTFHHALLHDVVYGRLLRKRRRELHRRVADVARALYGDGDDAIGLLARHLYLANAGADAVDALLRAGRRAASLYANDEAALHLERAVEVLRGLSDAADRLPAALLELADVQDIRGEYDDAYRLYDEVRVLTGDILAWRGLATVLRKKGDYRGALDVLDAVDSSDPGLTLERGYSLVLAGRADEARTALQTALSAGEIDSRMRALLLLRLAAVEQMAGRIDAAAEAIAEAIALFEQVDDVLSTVSAHRVAGATHWRAGRLEAARTSYASAYELAVRTGLVEESAGILLNLGMLHLEVGQVEQALHETTQAVEMFDRLGHGSGRAVGYGNLADVNARLGRHHEAEMWAERALEHAQRMNHVATLADASLTLARVRLAQERWDEAAARAAYAAARFRELGAEADAEACLALASEARLQVSSRPGRPGPCPG